MPEVKDGIARMLAQAKTEEATQRSRSVRYSNPVNIFHAPYPRRHSILD